MKNNRRFLCLQKVMIAVVFSIVPSMLAETFFSVKEGRATAEAYVMAPSRWHDGTDGTLVGSGGGHLLAFRRHFAPQNLAVDVEMAMDKCEGTAASLFFGDMNLIFDGGPSRSFFFERFDKSGQPIFVAELKKDYSIRTRRLFRLHLELADGQLAVTANDTPLGSVPFAPDGSVCIALRPHRNFLHVKSFCVTGTPAEATDERATDRYAHKFTEFPVSHETISIQNGGLVRMNHASAAADGAYRCTLAPANAEGIAIPFDATLKNHTLHIPENVCQSAYKAAAIPFNLRPALLTIASADGKALLSQQVILKDAKRRMDFPKGEVRSTGGHPEFWVDGAPIGTISGRLDRGYSPKIVGRAIREFAAAGVHDHLLIVFPYHFMKMDGKRLTMDWDSFIDDLQYDFSRIISEDPLARFHLHYELLVSSDWADAFPEEAIRLDNGVKSLAYGAGKKLQPSYVSPTWRRQAGKILYEAVSRLRNSPYADRISHWRLLYANCGEWNNWGYGEQAFVDFSAPMQKAFGEWLRRKYESDKALRDAWGRTDVAFDSPDLVPDRESRLAGGKVFRIGGKDVQSAVDYYEFFQECTVRTIEHFARIVKDASDRRLLVGAYYGYYWGHLCAGQFHQQDSGSYGMRHVIESPWLDFVGGPYPYDSRRSGQEVNGLSLTLARHGKIWESEGDMRTHYSGQANRPYGTTDSLLEDLAIVRRDWLLNRSRHAAFYFFDFVNDWYKDKELLDDIASLRRLNTAIRGIPDRHPSSVAIVISEESVPHFSNTVTPVISSFREHKRASDRAWGVPFDILCEADLKDTDFSQYKLVIIGNAAYASDETMRLTRERVMRGGRTVLFLHAPGVIGDDNAIHPERSRAFTGIGLKAEPEATFTEMHYQPGNSPYMQHNPMEFKTTIDDKDATVMCTYPDGAPAGAMKQLKDCTSIVLCHPSPNAAFMRHLFRKLGIHVYERNNTYNHYFFTGPLAAVYSRQKSRNTLSFPESYEIIGNVFTGEVLAKDANQAEFDTPETPSTTILFTGSAKEWERVRLTH
ncbi:MAG: hypothetical protein J5833_04050 [Victivallales bacterium]|nr:hypothetical protein [Victivallales bacterium]